MNKRREKKEVVYDMLQALWASRSGLKPTHLIYKSNISHVRLKRHIDELLEKGLVKEGSSDGKPVYLITDKGVGFLKEYERMRKFVDSFGI
jgi:predicted transcriptional regulator